MRLSYLNLIFLVSTFCLAQQSDVQLKNVNDTILNSKRVLKIAEPFDGIKTMQKLFPGKLYKLEDDNTFISWNCKACKPTAYLDVNGVEGDQMFPYQDGVATRLLSNIDYTDSKGNQFKLLTFNHSVYDMDGLQTGRFSGGLIGVAKFAKNGKVWEMRSFQPAVFACGAFSRAPQPKLVEIGEDQFALTVVHSNGGPGAPYSGFLYLLVGFEGKYQLLMEVDYYSLFNSPSSDWSSSFTVVKDNKKFFRDFIVTTTGSYKKAKNTEDDFEVDLPKELAQMAKTKKQFDFEIVRRFSLKGKFYKMTGQPILKFSKVK
ncbi:hypothetical protein BD847_1111 [Flavobacterium cutihirudinis]|uniref:Uncharacterized protein n=2 Tax=Flavobacterium cutihirudinis TaxID=1265740 RepID=A0A3D9G1T7_9FLAO|nr:hypothetical protein BD847_1111 [Flavobacterium cutihirudinis]